MAMTIEESWLLEQFAKGCGVESVIEALMASGHAPLLARQATERAYARWNAAAILAPSRSMATPLPVAPAQAAQAMPFRQVAALVSPHVQVFEGFLSDAECDTLIALARSALTPSTVVDPASGAHLPHPERLSEGTHLEHGSNPVVAAIEARIATCLGVPLRQQEATQILHYRVGGEYRPHFDFFPPEQAGSAAAIAAAGQRTATLVMYLNDVEAGGGTGFPEAGLTVAARKGGAVYFRNLDATGQPDRRSLHAGLPVLAGEKWIATKWFRERPVF